MSPFSLAKLLLPCTNSYQSNAPKLAAFPEQCRNALLIGPPQSGLTSVAFQFAFNEALASEGDILVLCRRTSLERAPPLIPLSSDHSCPDLQRIKIRYLQSHVELQQYAACMHMLPEAPAAVIVGDLSSFFTRLEQDKRSARDMQLAKTLAMLIDGVESIRRSSGRACPLLVTDECASASDDAHNRPGPPSLYILQRWLPLVLEVRGSQLMGFTLGVHPAVASAGVVPLPEQLVSAQVRYHVGQEQLVVQA